MIDTLSSKITSIVKGNLSGVDEEKAEVINYGLNILIYNIMVFTAVFSIALMLGVFKYALISFAVYGALRICAGGAHSQSRIECFVTYIITLFGIVLVSQYIRIYSYMPALILLIINFIVIWLYAPGDTVEKPILSEKIKKLQKLASLITVIIIFVLSLVALKFDITIYNIMIFSTVPVVIFLTPAGYKLLRCKHSYELS